MSKQFLTIEQQIDHLKNTKGLEIHNKDYATETLMQIGYFGLIGGYKQPFKNPTTKNYISGTCFEDIVALCKLDENLRELFLKYLLQIERHIRSLISYYFTEKYGEDQSHYLNSANFTNNPKYTMDITRLIKTLDKLANLNSDYPYIIHQRNTYGNVPLWVLINGLPFGTLSKFYIALTQDIKIKISKNFNKVNEKQLEQFLRVITKFRNICAHGERLFSFKNDHAIPNTNIHKKLLIPIKGNEYSCGKHDLFAVVIAFYYLLPSDDFKKFKQSLSKILNHYFAASNAISETSLYEQMGFPANWKDISKYHK